MSARLFDRGQTGYALTESGEAIRLKAEEIEEAVLSVEREAFGRDLRATGKVRVATAEDIATFVVAPKLGEFRLSHPGIVLEMVASWAVVNLTRREADIAIRTLRPTHGHFVVRKVGIWNCALYVSKAYAKLHKAARNEADISGLDIVSWTDESSFRSGDWFDKHARSCPSFSPPIRGTSNMQPAKPDLAPPSCLVWRRTIIPR